MTTINKFSPIVNPCREVKPPHLSPLKVVDGFQVYSSSFDLTLYIVFNHNKNLYCCYHYNGTLETFDSNLKVLIKTLFK